MCSGVIFTDDPDVVIASAREASNAAARRFFVHNKSDVGVFRAALPDFEFVPFEKATAPENGRICHGSTDDDLFVLFNTAPAKIPDRNLGVFQRGTKGTKIAVADHPFLGRADVWWLYFPYSYFDKNLLGYPHSYAFRDSRDPRAYDVEMLAGQVRSATHSTLARLFHDDIETIEVALSGAENDAYADLKERLFETQTTPLAIIKYLKKFVDATASMREAVGKDTFLSILDLKSVWPSYRSGIRKRFVSDAKVDAYLAGEFDKYVANVNGFLGALQ